MEQQRAWHITRINKRASLIIIIVIFYQKWIHSAARLIESQGENVSSTNQQDIPNIYTLHLTNVNYSSTWETFRMVDQILCHKFHYIKIKIMKTIQYLLLCQSKTKCDFYNGWLEYPLNLWQFKIIR